MVEIIKDQYTHVGIDDFVIRRRHTYGTCMADQETHEVIDLIPHGTRESVGVAGDMAKPYAHYTGWIPTVPGSGSRLLSLLHTGI